MSHVTKPHVARLRIVHVALSILGVKGHNNEIGLQFDTWPFPPLGRGVTSVYFHVSGIVATLTHTRVMEYDEACFMHLTPGVVHNFPKDVGV